MDFYWRKEWTAPAIGAVCFVAGVGTGYLYAKKKNEQAQDDIAEVALKAMGDLEVASSEALENNARVVELESALVAAEEANARLRTQAMEHALVPSTNQIDVVPDDPDNGLAADIWDQKAEEEDRTLDAPYIININEFVDNNKDYRQVTLEWFDGDKILCDENRVPIYGPDKVVGQLIFGHGCDDEDTVYVRNDANRAEYEIIRKFTSYAIEVMGMQADEDAEAEELRHSKAPRRFRQTD